MQPVIILAVIALISVITYLVWRAKTNWIVIFEDNGITDEASEQYSYLLNEGIRCRLKHVTVGSAGVGAAGVGQAAVSDFEAGRNEKVRVEVHKDQFDKATRLLENFNPKREFKI